MATEALRLLPTWLSCARFPQLQWLLKFTWLQVPQSEAISWGPMLVCLMVWLECVVRSRFGLRPVSKGRT